VKLLSDKQILAVDDEQIICEILKEEFSNHGAA
jgi:CheY-like chemotaxis protein